MTDARAEACKAAGNEYFKNKNHMEAVLSYTQGVLCNPQTALAVLLWSNMSEVCVECVFSHAALSCILLVVLSPLY